MVGRRVHDARVNRCDFACLPIVKAALKRKVDATQTEAAQALALAKDSALSAETAVLSGNLPEINVAGVLSTWLALESPNTDVRLASEAAYSEQVAYAAHLGLP
eukprot:COSAG03_NODE_9896_length_687_cov_1.227891_1_plen_103_part_10